MRIICIIKTIWRTLRNGRWDALVCGCDYVEKEVHTNCKVSVLKCEKCGKEDIAWSNNKKTNWEDKNGKR